MTEKERIKKKQSKMVKLETYVFGRCLVQISVGMRTVRLFVIFLTHSRQMRGQCLKL
jgi:hypothetical protein